MTIRVQLDTDLCEGHAQCVTAAPDVFTIDDDDGLVRLLIAEPPEKLRADIEWACALCPTRALTIKG